MKGFFLLMNIKKNSMLILFGLIVERWIVGKMLQLAISLWSALTFKDSEGAPLDLGSSLSW